MLFLVGPRQSELKCCKPEVANRQIPETSPPLKANEHTLLASPKRRPSLTLPPVYLWLVALPDEACVCASCWWSVGKSPQQEVSSLEHCLSHCQPHLVLCTKSWIPLLFNPAFISQRHWDIWAIILTASAKADRQLCVHALDDRSHKDVEKDRVEEWKLHIPQGRVFCYLSKSNMQNQLRAAHPARSCKWISCTRETGGVEGCWWIKQQ